jgi:ketol-acid reductoisomerase
MRDSGLDISYALRDAAITEKRQSFKNASENGFSVGTYSDMLPTADIVMNLTPDKQHSAVVERVIPFMKQGATFSYAHGFNIVEEGVKIREDLTVIMVAPKSPGSEVREEYKRGFGVPTLIAVHSENDPETEGLEIAKALCVAQGGHHAGVLESSFAAEVKSDLMGEQTILCGMLQAGSLLCYDKMTAEGIDPAYAVKLIQYGWETITEALKQGGITNMMDRLSNPAKIRAFDLAKEMKQITEQEYFDKGILMVAMVKAGVELAFDAMVESGIKDESAYYESLHETPLIANTIARKKLYEMNRIISDTAEYGCYLFAHAAIPMLKDFMASVSTDVIGKGLDLVDNGVDNKELVTINAEIRYHEVELIGEELRAAMGNMKAL